MNILVTGRDGQVGWELRDALATLGTVHALGRAELDLEDPDAIVARVRELRPAVIVNAAAYTAVDRAEAEPERAFAVNSRAPEILAGECRRHGALLVHYSTDYVFDGTARQPYTEDAPTGPVNVYGLTKLEGERAVRTSGCRHLVLRTSWVYAGRGRNFFLTMLRLARTGAPARVVDDQRGAPTWARAIAQATARALPAAVIDPGEGLFHLSAAGETSWHGFATHIFALANSTVPVEGIPSSAWPTPARRPAYSVLDNSRFRRHFGFGLPDWEIQLLQCFTEPAGDDHKNHKI